MALRTLWIYFHQTPSRFWFVSNDFCGLFCAFFSWFTVLYVDFAVVFYLLNVVYADVHTSNQYWYWTHITIFEFLCVMTLWSHAKAMFSNPGLVPFDPQHTWRWKELTKDLEPTDAKSLAKRESYCLKCERFKPRSAHHCSSCGRCIMAMDHHCPWVNNCVGQANLRHFLQFLVYVCLASIYAMSLMIWRLATAYMKHYYQTEDSFHSDPIESRIVRDASGKIVRLNPSRPKRSSFWSSSSPQEASQKVITALILISAFILAAFFCVFVIMMMYDQWDALTSGIPGIDAMKGVETDEPMKSLADGLRETCPDGRVSWKWLFPIHSHPGASVGMHYKEEIDFTNTSSEKPPLPPIIPLDQDDDVVIVDGDNSNLSKSNDESTSVENVYLVGHVKTE